MTDLDSATGEPISYWYNLKTGEVEVGKLSPATYRVGPFASFGEAQRALETLSERSKQWEQEESNED